MLHVEHHTRLTRAFVLGLEIDFTFSHMKLHASNKQKKKLIVFFSRYLSFKRNVIMGSIRWRYMLAAFDKRFFSLRRLN